MHPSINLWAWGQWSWLLQTKLHFSSNLHLLFQVAVWFWLPKRQNPPNYCLPIIIHHRGGFIKAHLFCTRQKCSMQIKSFHNFPVKPFVKNHAVIIISILWILPHPSVAQSLIGTSGKHNADLIICLPIVVAHWKINDVSVRQDDSDWEKHSFC